MNIESAIETWRKNKGIGTFMIPKTIDGKSIILYVLQKMYIKKKYKTLIITNEFNERTNIISYLTSQEDADNNKEFKDYIDHKDITIISKGAIEDKPQWLNVSFNICIIYNIDNLNDIVERVLSFTKFRLIILSKLLSNENRTKIYKLSPLIDDFKEYEEKEIRAKTPVEETLIPIDITDIETNELLTYYNEYISSSISIFGNLNVMDTARTGNKQLNISADSICYTIAKENGWNEQLDMSIPYNVEIDKIFNPINLSIRAKDTYSIIRKRCNLLSDYDGKLNAIAEIVGMNINSKILIINKNAEFASKVSDFINRVFGKTICANYHDKLDNIPAVDDKGNPIFYKTGSKKGERKFIGAKAQKSLNENLFNKDAINILSTNNSPDKSLNITVDIIIITSPQCEEIKNYIYRLDKLNFKNNMIKLYTLYIKNTLEERKLDSRNITSNHVILNKCENHCVYDENSDLVIVD